MSKISSGSSPNHPVWCSAKRNDGKPCGNKVQVSGAACYAHKRRAEKRLREKKLDSYVNPWGPPEELPFPLKTR